MNREPVPLRVRPPQQARSRAALQRILLAAEEVLAAQGFDDFTIAAVADRAGASVGAIYRRFENKELLLAAVKDRLLGELEKAIATRLSQAEPSLAGVIDAYTGAMAEALEAGRQVFPELLRGGRGDRLDERGAQTWEVLLRLVGAAAAPHQSEVRRADPAAAVLLAARTITSVCVHRAGGFPGAGQDVPWNVFADELSDMALAYLLTPPRPRR